MTPRRSVRAAARHVYSSMGGRELVLALAPQKQPQPPLKLEVAAVLGEDTPLPNPPPHSSPDGERPLAYGGREKEGSGGREQTEPGARGQAECAAGEQPDLMARVQALYEDSAVPVSEIARLVGVNERTLYRYVALGNWKRRYPNRKPRPDYPQVRGAGGRFIPRCDAGKPVVHGLKALDPQARAQAALACAAASARHAKARAKADAAQVWEARRRAIDSVSAAMAAYSRWRQGRARRAAKFFYEGGPNDTQRADDARTEALYVSQIEAAVACVRKLKL